MTGSERKLHYLIPTHAKFAWRQGSRRAMCSTSGFSRDVLKRRRSKTTNTTTLRGDN